MNIDKIESLKLSFSSAAKRKIHKEIDGQKLRNTERQYSEELTSIESEIMFSTEQLKDIKDQISMIRHQVSLVEICATSENIKAQTHVTDLTKRKRSYEDIFEKERHLAELRKKELKKNEEEEQEIQRGKEMEIVQLSEQLAREAAAVEKDCEAIERECAVLKKRNTAIMLKMRRKLVETENIRKDLLQKKNIVQ